METKRTLKAMQTKKLIKELKAQMLADYKHLMPTYYKAYASTINQHQLRLLFLNVISDHIIEKQWEAIGRKTRKGKTKFVTKTVNGEILAEEHSFVKEIKREEITV